MIGATSRNGIASTKHGKYRRRGSRRSFGFAYGAIKPATSCSRIENNKSARLHVGTPKGSTVSAPVWVRTMAPATPVVAGTKYPKRWLYPGALKGTHAVSSGRRLPPNQKASLFVHPSCQTLGGNKTCARYTSDMPEISRFLGIVIAMYYRDHAPPHFHAIYGDFEVTVEITSSQVNGQFPKRALAHVLEWSTLHQQELLDVWALARASRALPKIDPLE
jgi:hypothetical protein